MFKKVKITEDDANSLNFGIPVVFTLFLFIVNGIIFSAYYAESMLELFKIYLFFLFLILLYDFIQAKRRKGTKTIVQVNGYKNVILSSILVSLFLVINFIGATTIFETKIFFNKKYETSLKEYAIPKTFYKFYRVNDEEIRSYFHTGHYFHIKVAKSIFGYKILEQRTFEKL